MRMHWGIMDLSTFRKRLVQRCAKVPNVQIKLLGCDAVCGKAFNHTGGLWHQHLSPFPFLTKSRKRSGVKGRWKDDLNQWLQERGLLMKRRPVQFWRICSPIHRRAWQHLNLFGFVFFLVGGGGTVLLAFWKEIRSFLLTLICFYRNTQSLRYLLLIIQVFANKMLQLFICEILHFFLTIKSFSSDFFTCLILVGAY